MLAFVEDRLVRSPFSLACKPYREKKGGPSYNLSSGKAEHTKLSLVLLLSKVVMLLDLFKQPCISLLALQQVQVNLGYLEIDALFMALIIVDQFSNPSSTGMYVVKNILCVHTYRTKVTL